MRPPASEQFQRQLAEARTVVQNLRTQQALDAALRENESKKQEERILRLEMVIAAFMEFIPFPPGYLRRMVEFDAPGALKMSEQSSATAQLKCTQGAATLATPQLSSNASQGTGSSPWRASMPRDQNETSSNDFFNHDAANFCEQYLFDDELQPGSSVPDDEAL